MTTDSTDIAIREEHSLTLAAERRDLIKRQLCPGASDLELDYFLEVGRELGLSPLSKEIYAVMRKSREQVNGRWTEVEKMVIQIGIDGYRSIGARTGRFGGMRGPYWCGPDGEWKDVWLSEEPPAAAKVEIVLTDTRETVTGIATWREFAQWTPERKAGEDKKTGRTWEYRPRQLSEMWQKMGAHMLAKCSEAQAWRKALPAQTQHVLSAAAVEFAPDPSPPGLTIHMHSGDTEAEFAQVAEDAGMTVDEARHELHLSPEQFAAAGWPEVTMRLRAAVGHRLRNALLDQSMPALDGAKASELLYQPDQSEGLRRARPHEDRPMRQDEALRPAPPNVDIETGEIQSERDSFSASEVEPDYLGLCALCEKQPATGYAADMAPVCEDCGAKIANAETEPQDSGEAPALIPYPGRATTTGSFVQLVSKPPPAGLGLMPSEIERRLGKGWNETAKPEAFAALWEQLQTVKAEA